MDGHYKGFATNLEQVTRFRGRINANRTPLSGEWVWRGDDCVIEQNELRRPSVSTRYTTLTPWLHKGFYRMNTELCKNCFVPVTASLLAALGGPDFDRDIVISLQHKAIRRKPGDNFDRALDAPDTNLDGGGILPIHIARTRSERLDPQADYIAILIGFRGLINGGGYWQTLYGFRVPRVGWEKGHWADDLFLFGHPVSCVRHAENEGTQNVLTRKATCEWEYENMALEDALFLVESIKKAI